MIARTWAGSVPSGQAEAFHRHLLATGVADYRRQPGCLEVRLWRHDAEGRARFLLLSTWASLEAIRAYTGDHPEAAVLYPGDERFGLVPDRSATHYRILELKGSMSRDAYNSSRLTTPVGPFSHAVRSGGVAYLSGQVGQDPASGRVVDGVVEQTRQIFRNVRQLLDEMGLGLDDVQKVTVFLASMGDFAAVNGVYAEQFQRPYPARTTIAARELPLGALVEMEMVVRAI